MTHYTTTHDTDDFLSPPPPPERPAGDGWEMCGSCAVRFDDRVELYWFWKRREPEEQELEPPQMPVPPSPEYGHWPSYDPEARPPLWFGLALAVGLPAVALLAWLMASR